MTRTYVYEYILASFRDSSWPASSNSRASGFDIFTPHNGKLLLFKCSTVARGWYWFESLFLIPFFLFFWKFRFYRFFGLNFVSLQILKKVPDSWYQASPPLFNPGRIWFNLSSLSQHSMAVFSIYDPDNLWYKRIDYLCGVTLIILAVSSLLLNPTVFLYYNRRETGKPYRVSLLQQTWNR